MWAGPIGRAAAIATFLRNLLPIRTQADDGLPLGICRVEVMGHVMLTGRVRRLPGDLIEVVEEPDGIPELDRVDRRIFGAAAVYQIRPLSEAEKRAVLDQRARARRPCRHCGQVRCDRKGTVAEDVHVRDDAWADAWCGAFVGATPGVDTLTPEEAKRAAPGVITCSDCLEQLQEELATEQAAKDDAPPPVLAVPPPPPYRSIGVGMLMHPGADLIDEDTQDSPRREPVEP